MGYPILHEVSNAAHAGDERVIQRKALGCDLEGVGEGPARFGVESVTLAGLP